MLTVFRRGMLGDVEVSWVSGASTSTVFRSGDLFPLAGRKQFPSGQNTTMLTFIVSTSISIQEVNRFIASFMR